MYEDNGAGEMVVDQITPILQQPRGTRLTYYVGYLARDRANDTHLNRIASIAYELYEDGKVALTQRRLGPFCWEYIVTRK